MAAPAPSRVTVLVVDDNDANRYAVSRVLRGEGYHILEATSGREALAQLSQSPDLVILDVHLPDMDGFDVCRQIKADTATCATPVLILSAQLSTSEYHARGLGAGGDAFLTHPSPPHELTTLVRALLRMQRGERERAARVSAEAQVAAAALHVRELERAKEQAEWSEAGSRLLFESSPLPTLVVDVETAALLEVNAAAVAHYGYDGVELSSMTMWDLIVAAPAHRNRADLGDIVDALATVAQHRTKDGSSIDVEVLTHPFTFHAREARLVVVRDVTEHVRIERELRFQAQLLDVVEEAVIVTDPAGRISFWNRYAEQLYGWSADAVVGRDILEIFSTAAATQQATEILTNLAEGRGWAGELALHRRDGSEFLAQVTISFVHDDLGIRAGMIAVSQDITERRQIEQRMRQSHKMEAVGRLAGGVAHDFNNILTVISASSEFLRDVVTANPEALTDINEIQQASARGAALTRQLLAFSRQQVLAPQLLDLHDIIENVGKMLRRLIGEDISLSLRLSAAASPVLADPGQLEQVLVNLAVNARDAMPHGGELTVTTHHEQVSPTRALRSGCGAGDYIVLSVIDTGTGMSDDVKSRIFEPFFTTKSVGHGTGLGLATVHGIIEQSGGFVEVDSGAGWGTTFRLYLPRSASPRSPTPTSVPAIPTSRGAGTILLVEDETPVRMLTARILRQHGYEVIEAADGVAALDIAVTDWPSLALVLTDAIMPRLTGPQLAERLKALGIRLPVLYMSGYTDDRLLRTGALDGIVDFLHKPFTSQQLLSAVLAAIQRGRAKPGLGFSEEPLSW